MVTEPTVLGGQKEANKDKDHGKAQIADVELVAEEFKKQSTSTTFQVPVHGETIEEASESVVDALRRSKFSLVGKGRRQRRLASEDATVGSSEGTYSSVATEVVPGDAEDPKPYPKADHMMLIIGLVLLGVVLLSVAVLLYARRRKQKRSAFDKLDGKPDNVPKLRSTKILGAAIAENIHVAHTAEDSMIELQSIKKRMTMVATPLQMSAPGAFVPEHLQRKAKHSMAQPLGAHEEAQLQQNLTMLRSDKRLSGW